jgi:hypothetical protein
MAQIKVVRLYDSIYGNGGHKFSIVASDSSVRYVFPDNAEAFDSTERINRILKSRKDSKPSNTDEWLDVALTNLNSYVAKEVTSDTPPKTVKAAVETEKAELNNPENIPVKNLSLPEQQMNNAADSFMTDPEFESWATGESNELPEDAEKALILSMVEAAGTRDLNPWIDAWVRGEDISGFDMSNGLVLRKTKENIDNFLAEGEVQ